MARCPKFKTAALIRAPLQSRLVIRGYVRKIWRATSRMRAIAPAPRFQQDARRRRLEHQEVAAKLAARTRYWHRQCNHAEEASSLTLFLALLALHELVSVDFGLRRP